MQRLSQERQMSLSSSCFGCRNAFQWLPRLLLLLLPASHPATVQHCSSPPVLPRQGCELREGPLCLADHPAQGTGSVHNSKLASSFSTTPLLLKSFQAKLHLPHDILWPDLWAWHASVVLYKVPTSCCKHYVTIRKETQLDLTIPDREKWI